MTNNVSTIHRSLSCDSVKYFDLKIRIGKVDKLFEDKPHAHQTLGLESAFNTQKSKGRKTKRKDKTLAKHFHLNKEAARNERIDKFLDWFESHKQTEDYKKATLKFTSDKEGVRYRSCGISSKERVISECFDQGGRNDLNISNSTARELPENNEESHCVHVPSLFQTHYTQKYTYERKAITRKWLINKYLDEKENEDEIVQGKEEAMILSRNVSRYTISKMKQYLKELKLKQRR